ncbi:MAG: MYXO-CTERM sorting domain-containing protein [Myxococcales bacterium]|nr:MYXO-CTERM sorting domain-containing protein [Myxococcales bacterium]
MTRVALRLLPSALAALALGIAPDARAADVLVISNSGFNEVAADLTANTSHTCTGWNASVTPTQPDLAAYDVVLLFENGVFSNAVNVGNALRTFVDGGGDVVIGTFYWQDRSDAGFGGSWGTFEDVDPFTAGAGACEYSADDLDPASIVTHPMTAGVTGLHAGSYRGGVTAKLDTVVLATWTGTNNNGLPDPVIGYRTQADACIAGVSIFPDYPSYGAFGTDFSGDFYLIWDNVIANADANCTSCGDGVVDPGEACDDGGESATCNADCSAAMCGDGVTNMTAGEDCDDGSETATCDSDCTAVACGDGTANVTAGEECDDGGESATCDDDCSLAMCGDLVVNNMAGETCDEGGRTATCNADCTAVSCGDGVLNVTAGEECDDGGESATCDDDCTSAVCGDGVVNMSAGEECDDANTDDGDGCASDCLLEGGGSTGDESGTGSGGEGSGDGSGAESVDDTGGATSGDSMGSDGTGAADGGGTDGGDSGCSCTTGSDDEPLRTLWSLLGLLGLGVLRRRRRS